jgi:GT2 family glycosyltransferase
MTSSPVASVIIPSFQSAETIESCLEGIFNQVAAESFEVIVADSGDDATAEVVARRFPQVRVLKSTSRLDPAQARNWGVRESRGSILVFIDSDCIPDRHWLARLCAVLEDRTYDAVGGAIRNANGTTAASWAGYFCEFREFLPGDAPCDRTYLTPGNTAYRRETFERAGGFPVGYYPMEDQVFYDRLRAVGARIRFDPRIIVAHHHRSGVREFLAHQRKLGAANALVVRRLGLQGAEIASRRWLAAALLPALATYRFARTVAACWTEERCLMLRRPDVTGLCWLGMMAWGVGFSSREQPASRQPVMSE